MNKFFMKMKNFALHKLKSVCFLVHKQMSFIRIGTTLISTENIRQVTISRHNLKFIDVELYNKGSKRYEWVSFSCGDKPVVQVLEEIEKSSGEKKNR